MVKLVLLELVRGPHEYYAVFYKNDSVKVNVPIVINGIQEHIDFKTQCSTVWAPLMIDKEGHELVWNFGDGTGDQEGSCLPHDFRGLEGWKDVRLTAPDGFKTVHKLALYEYEPLNTYTELRPRASKYHT